jgi:hypothetical protein
MSKRLNSGLFEDFPAEKVQAQAALEAHLPTSLGPVSHAAPIASPAAPAMASAHSAPPMLNSMPAMNTLANSTLRADSMRMMDEMNSIKAKMRGYESQIDVFRNQMSDFVRNVDQRFERVSQALARMEKSIHAQGRDGEEKIRQVREKIQSQNFEEAKIEGLIERQTVVIRNFENRLASMQKIINEKELLLMKYFEALRQAQLPKK